MAGGGGGEGKVACAAWIRRREEKEKATRVFAAYGRAGSPPAVEVLGFDSKECSLSEPLVRTGAPPSPPPPPSSQGIRGLVRRLDFRGRGCVVCLFVLQARAELGEEPGDAPRGITVHPSGDELVCATAKGCRCVPPLLLFSLTVLSFAGISQAGRGGVI